jgi:hypothetical protein
MNPLISSQQVYFFNNHGYLELEEIFSSAECDELQTHIDAALFSRIKRSLSRIPGEELYMNGRDLWRSKEALKTLLLSKRMTAVALGLTNKSSLHLACDQWLPPLTWLESEKTKDLFSIQGLACVYFIRLSAPIEPETLNATFGFEPGLIPLPAKRGNLLAVNPNLLLNLPKLSLHAAGLYAVAYAFPNAVYFHNSKDPCNHLLKAFGYNFGDRLTHTHHPLVRG